MPKVNNVRPQPRLNVTKGTGDAGRIEELTNQVADFKVILNNLKVFTGNQYCFFLVDY